MEILMLHIFIYFKNTLFLPFISKSFGILIKMSQEGTKGEWVWSSRFWLILFIGLWQINLKTQNKIKATLKKCTNPQDRVNAHSQRDQKCGSFSSAISDGTASAAVTGSAKAPSHVRATEQGTGTRNAQTWKSHFISLEVMQEVIKERWLL